MCFVLALSLSGCFIESLIESDRYEFINEILSPNEDLKIVSYVRKNGATSLNCYRLSIQDVDKKFNGMDYVNAKKDAEFFACDYENTYYAYWDDNNTVRVVINNGIEPCWQDTTFKGINIIYEYEDKN